MNVVQLYEKLDDMRKQKRIDEIKNILQNTNLSEFIDISGKTLLHLAVEKGNVEMIELLLDSKQDINAQDAAGKSPILIASELKNFEIVKILLDNQADIFIADATGFTLLDSLMQNKKLVPSDVFESYSKRLKTSGIDIQNIVQIFKKTNCSLDFVLLMKDPVLTRAMLDSYNFSSVAEPCALINQAMNSFDFDNLEILLSYGSGIAYRKKVFLQNITSLLRDVNVNLNTLKTFLKYMIKWDIFERELYSCLWDIFRHGREKLIKMILDCEIDQFVMEKLSFSLIPNIFTNEKFEASKLMKNRRFDANAQDEYGYTSLQLAVRYNMENNVKFLLDLGADPNGKGKATNKTPLQLASTEKCVVLLLNYGADFQVEDKFGIPIMIFTHERFKPLQAHFILACAQGFKKIKKELLKNSYWAVSCLEYLDFCRKQVEWMKKQKINDYLTIFYILSESVENLIRYIRDQDLVTEILNIGREGNLDNYYFSSLELKLSNVMWMHECRSEIAELIAEIMELYDGEHLVIRKIVGFLTVKDLLVFS